MPSAGGMPAGTSLQGMGFISSQARGGEDQLFLPTHRGKQDLPFPRQKLLVTGCLFPSQGTLPGAQKWQDVSGEVAEREHPGAWRRESEPGEGSLEEEPRDCHDTALSSVLIVRLGPNLAWCNSAEVTRDSFGLWWLHCFS